MRPKAAEFSPVNRPFEALMRRSEAIPETRAKGPNMPQKNANPPKTAARLAPGSRTGEG